MADAVLQLLLANLNTFIQNQIGLTWGFQKEMEKLSSKLATIHAVLEDAETKQLRDKAIKIWLRKLKSAAYEVDDILDDCATEASRLEFRSQQSSRWNNNKVAPSSSFSFCCYSLPNVLFRYKMGSRIKEITEQLDAIAEERVKFHLNETVLERRNDANNRRQTGSVITEQYVYGREDDKEKIVQLLVNPEKIHEDLSVLPILGMGGLGKTTLAQLIFNDERVARHFEPRIWICVSNDFDVKKLLKTILESLTKSRCEVLQLDSLQKRVRELLNGKRYLLVLDDVWNDQQEDWARLKYVLACGSAGTFIITTTRLLKVVTIMGTIPAYSLTTLSEDDCWLLFKQRAFPQDIDLSPKFVEIGKEIVEKCKGVPLAAKSLGGLMRFKTELKDWIFIKESEIWNLPQDGNSILPALRLSYNNLMPDTKNCFAYCAVFAKDYVMDKENLINLWMANGFLSSYGRLEMEEKGEEIWNELYWSSFFQDLEKDELENRIFFKMHDLVHDLAQSVVDDECLIIDDSRKSEVLMNKNVHHLTFTSSIVNVSNKIQLLRSIFILGYSKFPALDAFRFKKWGLLRVLDASGLSLQMTELMPSIGNLRKLRYLNLCNCIYLKFLPESICKLWNLQILNLNRCWNLKTLPKRLRDLRNLRHLYLEGCDDLNDTPPKIGQLTCLKTLSVFFVGEHADNSLSELENLNLGGSLEIRNLERVRNLKDAMEANLILKQNLRRLILQWKVEEEEDESLLHSEEEKVEQVLEALEPCSNHLQVLEIYNYGGTRFPSWFGDDCSTTLQNIVQMKLYGFRTFLKLPQSIGRLPKLRLLDICGMDRLEYLLESTITTSGSSSSGDYDDDGAEEKSVFPRLEELKMCELPNLRRLVLLRRRGLHYDSNKCNDDDDDESATMIIFPLLHSMNIFNCHKLVELSSPPLPSSLLSLKTLKLHGKLDEVLLSCSIPKLTALADLVIHNDNEELTCLPEEIFRNPIPLKSLSISGFIELPRTDQANLSSLQSLTIGRCHCLGSLSEQELRGLHSLRDLVIDGSENLKSIADEGVMRDLTSLERLEIYRCPELVSLLDGEGDDGMEHLKSLQTLIINNCPKIASLPASIQSLTKLSSLYIFDCPLLTNRCRRGGKDWPKISRIPNVHLLPS